MRCPGRETSWPQWVLIGRVFFPPHDEKTLLIERFLQDMPPFPAATPTDADKSFNASGFEAAAIEAREKARQAGLHPTPPGSNAATGAATSSPEAIPPEVRSALQQAAQASMVFSRYVRGNPGLQGAIFHRGKPFCFAVGYRDAVRGVNADDKGNHLRLKDPMCYHSLTMPVVGLAAWRLHVLSKEQAREDRRLAVGASGAAAAARPAPGGGRGCAVPHPKDSAVSFDLFAPLTTYLPELPNAFSVILCRDVLAWRAALPDARILSRALGIVPTRRSWLPSWASSGASGASLESAQCFDGIRSMFPDDNPAAARASLVGRLSKLSGGDVQRLGNLARLPPNRSRPSHIAFALLAHAIERAVDRPFEEFMREDFFLPMDAPSAGFGPPRVIQQSNVFFQVSGVPSGHRTFHKSVDPGSADSVAPALFNASLNLFAPPEEFSKLIVPAVENAVKETKPITGSLTPPSSLHKYVELGFLVNPMRKQIRHVQRFGPYADVFTPWSAALSYEIHEDVGAFSVGNCGTRRARLATNLTCAAVTKLYVRHCMKKGVDFEAEETVRDPAGRAISVDASSGIPASAQTVRTAGGGPSPSKPAALYSSPDDVGDEGVTTVGRHRIDDVKGTVTYGADTVGPSRGDGACDAGSASAIPGDGHADVGASGGRAEATAGLKGISREMPHGDKFKRL